MSESSRASFGKLNPLLTRPKTIRVMVLGQESVGKSALVVRFITKRFIGEYDKNLEKVYSFQTTVDNESVLFEILDTAGQPQDDGCLVRESNIRWAEAFVLMYSVTDKCSFEDCTRLKFLINYNKRKKKLGSECKDSAADVPVLLIGNKSDLTRDRMVTKEEGLKRSKDIGCVCFHEISVRENVDQVRYVFRDVFHFWKAHKKLSKLKISSSESENGALSCLSLPFSNKSPSSSAGGSASTLSDNNSLDVDESMTLPPDEHSEKARKDGLSQILDLPPFRSRAQTDGVLSSRCCSSKTSSGRCTFLHHRRMSISMKGKNSSC